MIGMATIINSYPLYAEAVNEAGLGMAGLNFPENADYNDSEQSAMVNITPYEIIPWMLGQFKTVSEVKEALENVNIVAIDFMEGVHVSPLHWIIADKDETIVLEVIKTGLHVYDNPIGVLTNNPTFDYHMLNMKNYLGLSAKQPENNFTESTNLTPFGQGLGGFGLPGDYSPTSRFIKAAFIKEHSISKMDEDSNVAQFFHILDSVAMVEGSVITPQNKKDITLYSCCINGRTGDYYYKSYTNNQISVISMRNENLDSKNLLSYDVAYKQNYKKMN